MISYHFPKLAHLFMTGSLLWILSMPVNGYTMDRPELYESNHGLAPRNPGAAITFYIMPGAPGGAMCNKNDPCNYYTAWSSSLTGDTFIFKGDPAGDPVVTYKATNMGYPITPSSLITISSKTIYMYGGWDGNPTLGAEPVLNTRLYPSIMDGENTYRIFTMRGNANASVIDGFTMKNGYAKGATNEECHATGVSGVPACGGAVYVDQGATPTIQNNMIVSNVAVNEDSRTGVGGGIYAYESPGIKILNNEIYANSANSLDTGFGGAIYLNSCVSNPTIEGNNFWWNWATLSPNTGWGATIALEASGLVRIVNNHFYQNNPGGLSNLAGTAIYSLISSMIIRDNVFYDNYFGTVIYLAGGYTSMSGNYLTNPDANYGMQIVSAMVNMTNNIISDHKVGDVQIWGSADNFADLEFFYNTTASIDTEDTDYGIIIGDYVDGEFSYGIAANHYYGFYNAGHVIGEITISYYLMDGNIYNYADFTHTNDFTGNPLFVNPGNGDYHIQYGSAAINKGPGLTTVIIDIDHQRRPNYSYGWLNPADLGADEYCLPRYFPFIKK